MLKLCQAQFKLKVESRFVLLLVEVQIEAELILKSFILYFCSWVGVEKLTLKIYQLSNKLKLKLELRLAT